MEPIVSVILLTYNHEKYIRECLESVVGQKTDFPFEIIIGDDCSNDGTRLVCEEYRNKFPKLINLLPREKNLGLPDNLIQTLSFAKGNFIAFIEGDDYWTDNAKLQTQYDILIREPGFVAVTHNTDIIDGDKSKPLLQTEKTIFNLEDTANGRIFHTNSWFVRKDILPGFNQYHEHLICWDVLMELKILEQGQVFFINKSMSVWRKHEAGNSVKISLKEQYHHFERLYKMLINEGSFKKHYVLTLKNFYGIFAYEMARWDSVLFTPAIKNSLLWQAKILRFDLKFIPRLLLNFLRKNRHTHHK